MDKKEILKKTTVDKSVELSIEKALRNIDKMQKEMVKAMEKATKPESEVAKSDSGLDNLVEIMKVVIEKIEKLSKKIAESIVSIDKLIFGFDEKIDTDLIAKYFHNEDYRDEGILERMDKMEGMFRYYSAPMLQIEKIEKQHTQKQIVRIGWTQCLDELQGKRIPVYVALSDILDLADIRKDQLK